MIKSIEIKRKKSLPPILASFLQPQFINSSAARFEFFLKIRLANTMDSPAEFTKKHFLKIRLANTMDSLGEFSLFFREDGTVSSTWKITYGFISATGTSEIRDTHIL